MLIRNTLAATVTAMVLLTTAGCAVTRGQETVGAYVDDAAITTSVKARFVDNSDVDAASIKVERSTAESIARKVNGVKMVKNEVVVRP
jgi:hyperosmotically inducible periplasmic protein